MHVGQFVEAAQRVCNVQMQMGDVKQMNAFLCLDMTYITALLVDGFGFLPDTTLIVSSHTSHPSHASLAHSPYSLLSIPLVTLSSPVHSRHWHSRCSLRLSFFLRFWNNFLKFLRGPGSPTAGRPFCLQLPP